MAELDPRQRAAVDAGPIDVFISAGAGSGKTRVLSSRFSSAVLGAPPYRAVAPQSLLTVTFTEKAASELIERIRGALIAADEPEAARQLGDAWISTIHGMCSRILRRHALAAGLDPHFTVLDAIEASVLEAEAEEQAFREALSRDAGVVELIDAYGMPVISAALRSAVGDVRALGLGAEHLVALPPTEATRRLEETAGRLGEIATALGGMRRLATVENDRVTIRAARDVIEDALCACRAQGAQVGAAAAAMGSLTARGLRRCATVEGLDELVDEARELITEGRTCLAQLAVAERETSFLSLARLFDARHRALKRAKAMLDFEDLQTETARLLVANPEVRDHLKSRFSMIMVDEFQDTNALQMRILGTLASGNLCTVGDENQSIYAFRHADVEVFRERARNVGARYQLDINYRIEPGLLSVLNELFSHPALLGPHFMALSAPEVSEPRPPWPPGRPRFDACFIDWSDASGIDAKEAEAACVADVIEGLVRDGIDPGGIAVLMGAVTGGRAQSVERSLAGRGIPAVLSAGGRFFECREIVEARSLMKLIDNVWDDSALLVVLAGRLTCVGAEGLAAIRSCADDLAQEGGTPRDAHLWDALVSERLVLAQEEAAAVRRTVGVVHEARRLRGLRPVSASVLEPLLALDADLVYFADQSGGSRALANILKLARLASEYETATSGDLRGFLEYLDLREMHSASEQEATLEDDCRSVRVMSIHAAKGLEFPVVVVAGLAEGPGPQEVVTGRVDGRPTVGMKLRGEETSEPTLGWKRVVDASSAVREAESRRLLYVACTRAQEGLAVVTRIRPDRDADDSLPGALRRALGVGGAGMFDRIPSGQPAEEGRQDLAWPAAPRVSLLSPAGAGEAASQEVSRGGPASRGIPGNDLREGQTVQRRDVVERQLARPADTGTPSARPELVSYTGLANYKECPFRYFLMRVAGLEQAPAQGGQALAFGTALHAVLEHSGDAGHDLTSRCRRAAVAAGLPAASLRRLVSAVRSYLSLPVAAEVAGAERAMREAPIAIPVGAAILVGAIDILAWVGDSALVVDYKTGAGGLPAEEALERYRLQGECYALAAFAAGASSVRVVFAEVERRRETTYTYTAGDRVRLEASVADIIGRIGRAEFEPRGSYEAALCRNCPGFRTMCAVGP